jgi:hypothetical protein
MSLASHRASLSWELWNLMWPRMPQQHVKTADHFAWDGLASFTVVKLTIRLVPKQMIRSSPEGLMEVLWLWCFLGEKKNRCRKERSISSPDVRWMVKAMAKVKLRIKVSAWCSGADDAAGPTHPWAPDFSLRISSFEGTSVRQFTCSGSLE